MYDLKIFKLSNLRYCSLCAYGFFSHYDKSNAFMLCVCALLSCIVYEANEVSSTMNQYEQEKECVKTKAKSTISYL